MNPNSARRGIPLRLASPSAAAIELGTKAGRITGTITAAGISVLPATNADSVIPQGIQPADLNGMLEAVRSGITYVNVHTANLPTARFAAKSSFTETLLPGQRHHRACSPPPRSRRSRRRSPRAGKTAPPAPWNRWTMAALCAAGQARC